MKVSKYAWVAFLPPFGYGFLKASLNGNFPVHALRSGIDISMVSIIITSFSAGSLMSQIPFGVMSDKIGRRKVLLFILFFGFLILFSSGFLYKSPISLLLCFLLTGVMVGSTFSLGISYMADLVPRNLLPTGNLLCGIFFSVGSICGPFIGQIGHRIFKRRQLFFRHQFHAFAHLPSSSSVKERAAHLPDTQEWAPHKNI
ncbi:MFS transporter [Bacillus sp. V5-8f]|uniref:MFS transporter n=1 Tax=Bacillus sp. V5-8f TaxID=2053044 RepID=UPI0021554DFC|nr:MFS transporter [Bacillus sp. V5-8f]